MLKIINDWWNNVKSKAIYEFWFLAFPNIYTISNISTHIILYELKLHVIAFANKLCFRILILAIFYLTCNFGFCFYWFFIVWWSSIGGDLIMKIIYDSYNKLCRYYFSSVCCSHPFIFATAALFPLFHFKCKPLLKICRWCMVLLVLYVFCRDLLVKF